MVCVHSGEKKFARPRHGVFTGFSGVWQVSLGGWAWHRTEDPCDLEDVEVKCIVSALVYMKVVSGCN